MQKKVIDDYIAGTVSAHEIADFSFESMGRVKLLLRNHIYRDFRLSTFHSVDFQERDREMHNLVSSIESWYKKTYQGYSLAQNQELKMTWDQARPALRVLSYISNSKHFNLADLASTRRYLEIFDPNHRSGTSSDNYESAKYWIQKMLTDGSLKNLSEFKEDYVLEVDRILRSLP